MRRIAALLLVAAFTLASAPMASPEPEPMAVQRPPNIVIFLSDDARRGSVRPDVMPQVYRRIVGRGTTFTRFYSTTPLCCPSRASILTGLYARSTQTYTNQDGVFDLSAPWIHHGGTYAFHEFGNESRTIAFELDAQGYQTALFGKYLNGYARYADTQHGDGTAESGAGWRPAGWDHWNAFYENNGKYWDYRLNRNGAITSYGQGGQDNFSTTVLGRDAAAWVRAADPDQPFFMLYAPYSPHLLARADPRDEGRFLALPPMRSPAVGEDTRDKPTYIRTHDLSAGQIEEAQRARIRQFRSLFSMDRQIGHIMDAVRDRRQASNTIFLYLSDNGQALGEHDWIFKVVPYEPSTHVPAVLRYDGVVPMEERAALVSTVDVKQTLMRLAGFGSSTAYVDGVDMLSDSRNALLLEAMFYPHPELGSVPSYCGLVTRNGRKYVIYAPPPSMDLVRGDYEDEMYDLQRDPYELSNLLHRPTARSLARRDALREILEPMCAVPHVPDEWYAAW